MKVFAWNFEIFFEKKSGNRLKIRMKILEIVKKYDIIKIINREKSPVLCGFYSHKKKELLKYLGFRSICNKNVIIM